MIDKIGKKTQNFPDKFEIRCLPNEGCRQPRDLKLWGSHFFRISHIFLRRAYHTLRIYVTRLA